MFFIVLRAFDLWLLYWFERFHQWWYRLSGRDCFWLAKMSLILMVLFWLADDSWKLWQSIFRGENWAAPLVVMLILSSLYFVLIYFVWYVGILKKAEARARQAQESGFANPDKMNHSPRLIMFFLAFIMIVFSFSVYDRIGYIFMISFFYFIACDLLPPEKSKVRKWVEAFSAKRKEILSPSLSPQPAPVKNL